MKNIEMISPNIRTKAEKGKEQILETILENTEKIKNEVLKKEHEIEKMGNTISDKEEARKEQLRDAQKKFKKIGANFRDDVADKFEELAQKLNYTSTSAMCKSYLLLLLESKKFQTNFIEFREMQKELSD
jgi:NAD dependent epimerase/dehydratase family enzyme